MNQTPDLMVKDLHVSVEGKEILKGLSLEVRKGQARGGHHHRRPGVGRIAGLDGGHPGRHLAASRAGLTRVLRWSRLTTATLRM
jgi:hypothetical protein